MSQIEPICGRLGNLPHQEVELGGVLRSLPASICEAILDARDGELESAEDVLCVTLKGKRAPLGGDRCLAKCFLPGLPCRQREETRRMTNTATSSAHRIPMVLAQDVRVRLSGTHTPLGL